MIIGVDGNEANIEKRVGSGQYAYELISHLLKSDHKNTYYIYLKEKPLEGFPRNKNSKFLIFGPKKFWTQFALPLKLFSGPRPDVFFAPSHYGPRFSSVPIVITIFDLSYIHFPKLFRRLDLYQLQHWTEYSVKKAKAILTISQASKEDIIKHYKVDPKKVFVTYPGYDDKLFKPVNDQKAIGKVKEKYKIAGDYIFFLGTIQPRKNLIRLLEAVEGIKNIKVVISGKKGWLYDDFFKKIEDPKVRDKIIVTDYVQDEDLPVLFSGARTFILPSLWEGFGIPVLEAMACGCPVVVSDKSSLSEVVEEAGVLINPEDVQSITDGIQKVLTNNKFAQVLSRRGLIRAKEFSWRRCAYQTLSIIKSAGNVA